MYLQGFEYYATLLLVREIGGKLYKKKNSLTTFTPLLLSTTYQDTNQKR